MIVKQLTLILCSGTALARDFILVTLECFGKEQVFWFCESIIINYHFRNKTAVVNRMVMTIIEWESSKMLTCRPGTSTVINRYTCIKSETLNKINL